MIRSKFDDSSKTHDPSFKLSESPDQTGFKNFKNKIL